MKKTRSFKKKNLNLEKMEEKTELLFKKIKKFSN